MEIENRRALGLWKKAGEPDVISIPSRGFGSRIVSSAQPMPYEIDHITVARLGNRVKLKRRSSNS